MDRRTVDVADLVARARAGEARAVGRLISLVEHESPALRDVAMALSGLTGRAHVVGLTGAPGVGKSTSTSALVTALRRRHDKVGVLAVDPSSPFTGGALLGDRIRMQDHAVDAGVFIRSMASRGRLGGLAAAAPQAVRVLDAAGCSAILLETVGVGQSEIDVAELADTTIVLLAPGMGDGIQAAKAGILEIGDVFVVNKADREGAEATRRELRSMIAMAHREPGDWRPPVLLTVATSGEGVDELAEQLAAHREHLERSGQLEQRRRQRLRREIESIALATVSARLIDGRDRPGVEKLVEAVLTGSTDPFTAADSLLEQL